MKFISQSRAPRSHVFFLEFSLWEYFEKVSRNCEVFERKALTWYNYTEEVGKFFWGKSSSLKDYNQYFIILVLFWQRCEEWDTSFSGERKEKLDWLDTFLFFSSSRNYYFVLRNEDVQLKRKIWSLFIAIIFVRICDCSSSGNFS